MDSTVFALLYLMVTIKVLLDRALAPLTELLNGRLMPLALISVSVNILSYTQVSVLSGLVATMFGEPSAAMTSAELEPSCSRLCTEPSVIFSVSTWRDCSKGVCVWLAHPTSRIGIARVVRSFIALLSDSLFLDAECFKKSINNTFKAALFSMRA